MSRDPLERLLESVSVLLGEVNVTFEMPDEAAAKAGLETLQHDAKTGAAAGFSANVWRVADGPFHLTLLTEMRRRQALDGPSRVLAALGGREVIVEHSGIIVAQRRKRTREWAAWMLRPGSGQPPMRPWSADGYLLDQEGGVRPSPRSSA